MSTDSSWIELAVACVALLVLTLAAFVEASLAAVNRVTLREMIEERTSPHRVQSFIEHPQLIRSTMTLVQLLAALVAGAMLTRVFTREFPGYGLLLALVVGTIALVVAGRVLPGALTASEQREESRRLNRLSMVLAGAVWPLTAVADLIIRLLRRGPQAEAGNGEDIGEAHDGGNGDLDIEEDEQEMISGVLGLEEATVREIMVPRLDIVAAPQDMSIAEVVDLARSAGHSRIPVYRDSIDSIVGVIYAKDLLRFVNEEATGVKLLDLLRPAYFVPESKHVDELLRDMRQAKVHIAIVVDEYGGTAGLVTIEDILEEIVGEIRDEFDEEEPAISRLPDGSYSIDGRIPIGVVNEALGTGFESEDFDTIGGLVLGQLGRAPEVGDEVVLDGYALRVEDVDGPRVSQLLARHLPDSPEEGEEG